MPRPLWTGSIAFGLVNIPVKLFSAVSHKDVHFHMLHQKDGGRIQQKRVCTKEDKEVPYRDIAKGYEISRGRYVMIDPEELEALDPETTKTIDIEDFVDLEEIDPIYYQDSYYLVPDRAAKPYGLLFQAMKKTGKVAIARMVMRTKQYLCALRPMDHALTLSTMLYQDEVVPQRSLDALPKSSSPSARELSMAEQLISSLSGKFDPSKYKDEYRERVLALIARKAKGEKLEAPEPAKKSAKVINLMDALKKSLEGGTDRRATHRAAEPRSRGAHKASRKTARPHRARKRSA